MRLLISIFVLYYINAQATDCDLLFETNDKRISELDQKVHFETQIVKIDLEHPEHNEFAYDAKTNTVTRYKFLHSLSTYQAEIPMSDYFLEWDKAVEIKNLFTLADQNYSLLTQIMNLTKFTSKQHVMALALDFIKFSTYPLQKEAISIRNTSKYYRLLGDLSITASPHTDRALISYTIANIKYVLIDLLNEK